MVRNVYPKADVELLKQNGVFCYDYIDSLAWLDEAALPPRKAIFNKLGGVECSQAEYAHAQHVWENFHCQSLKEYMVLYLLSDICLLADVFQAIRNNSLDEYQLDLAYFLSAPQLAWNALLKYIDQAILLIIDLEMYHMIHPNIRGCIFRASVRYARANNKLMGSLYDPRQPTSYIMEIDTNNLYAWNMSQKMPNGDFKFLSEEKCRDLGLLLNYEDGRMAIFDT